MADTIFMIHGMWGGGWYWQNYVQFFENEGYKCIAPTIRYHDISSNEEPDPRLGSTSILNYAEDLEREIRLLDLDEPPILMGHSMGGLLAQILASRRLAKALVLLTPASPRGINALTFSVIRCFLRPLFRYGFWRKHHRLTFRKSVYAILHLMPPNEQKSVYEKMVFESGRAAAEIGMWWADSNKATEVDESKITCPILVIAGKEDRITPEKVVKMVAKKYSALDYYKAYENHAHWIIGEPGWEEVAKDISDWLKKNL